MPRGAEDIQGINIKVDAYYKRPLTDLWWVNLVFERAQKAKLDKQQKMLLSLRSNL